MLYREGGGKIRGLKSLRSQNHKKERKTRLLGTVWVWGRGRKGKKGTCTADTRGREKKNQDSFLRESFQDPKNSGHSVKKKTYKDHRSHETSIEKGTKRRGKSGGGAME